MSLDAKHGFEGAFYPSGDQTLVSRDVQSASETQRRADLMNDIVENLDVLSVQQLLGVVSIINARRGRRNA